MASGVGRALKQWKRIATRKGYFDKNPGGGKDARKMKKGGRAGYNIGGRANLLEEMGRLDAEKMNPNRRAEKHRVIGELNRGYKSGKEKEIIMAQGDKDKDYKLGLKLQGDYKGKSLKDKAKEFVKTAGKQIIGTAKKYNYKSSFGEKMKKNKESKAKGGRPGFKVGGAAKRGISKILRKK